MPTILANLIPAKNLNWGVVGAIVTVLIFTISKHVLGLDIAASVANLLSTPTDPVSPQSVLLECTGAIGYLISHGVDVWDNFKKTQYIPVPQKPQG